MVRVLVAITALTLAAASADAQQFTGGVCGAVRDANGVIPGATVTITNEATNISREVVTNEVGQYNFPAVAPGTYTLRSQISGYKRYESKGLVVGTQQFLTLDVTLELGALEESITVTGQSPLIDTSTASTGAVLDQKTLESLPAPGRNAYLMGVTVPTVMPTGDPQFNRQQDQTNASRVSMGGGGIRANNYLLDGVPISELRGRAVLNPTMEAVDEVKVQVHTYDAEMGRTGGGVFNVTLKSGANAYHGSGFYQTRPVWGQNENFFNAAQGLTKDETGLADAYYRLYGGGVAARSRRTRRSSGRRLKATARGRRATSRRSGRPPHSATATSRTRRSTARRPCSTTRGAAAAWPTRGVPRPAPDRLPPVDSSPARSFR